MSASPTCDIITLRAAVASAIGNAITSGPVFGPIPAAAVLQVYDAITKPKDLTSGGRILVMPVDRNAKPLTRGGNQRRTIKIDVGVQAKLKSIPAAIAETDPYLNQALAIADLLDGKPLTVPTPGAAMVKELDHVLFVPEWIRDDGIFTSILHLTIEYAG